MRATAPSEAEATAHRDTITVGPDSALIEIEWHAFAADPGQYLLSANTRLLREVRYDSLSLSEPGTPFNVGAGAAVIEAVTLAVQWSSHGGGSRSFGTESYDIRADGKGGKR